MAMSVIDPFEVIQIEHHDPGRVAGLFQLCHAVAQDLRDARPVA